MHQLRSRLAWLSALGFASVVYGCGAESLVLPNEAQPAKIEIVGGNAQEGPVGAGLSDSLVVAVTDSRGRPVENQAVEFTPDGSGSTSPDTVQTLADGTAASRWTLGPSAGIQHLQARVVGDNVPPNLLVSFHATAVAGAGSALQYVSGDGQSGPVKSALADSLVVRVVDALGNPVAGVEVDWSVSGGGSVDPVSVVTGGDGRAATARVLGPTADSQSADATAAGLAGSPVHFTHTAVAANPTVLVMVSGDGQSAPAGFEVSQDLVVQLRDDDGNGVGEKAITWVVPPESGSVNPVNSTTDPSGFARTRWTLGPEARSYTLNAVYSGLPSVPFTATATADVPATIALDGGDNQTAVVLQALPAPLSVKVSDAHGNPVQNVSVAWEAQGGGSVSSPTSATDASGIARITRTLGPTPGPYGTTATVEGLSGSPVRFTSNATIGSAARLVFTVPPSTATVGQTFSPSVTVEVQDAQGNLVVTATNTITVSLSVSGRLSGTNSVKAVAGVAVFPDLAVTRAGTGYTMTALASSLASTTSDPFDVTPAATTTAITNRSPSTSVTGQSVTVSFSVAAVAPGSGTPTGSVTVSDGTASCSATVSTGNCAITLASAGAHTLTAAYAGDPNFLASTSSGVSHTVNKAATTLAITSDDPDPSLVGDPVTITWQLGVSSPGSGTPTGNVTVTVSGGAATCSAAASAGSCDITLTGNGSRTLTAAYAGDANFGGKTDTEGHVVQGETSTTVASDNNPATAGESITFTATVSAISGSGTLDGKVQFKVDGANLGDSVSISGGKASRTTSVLTVGSHAVTAEYAGNSRFAGSTGTLSPDQVVNPPANQPPTAADDPQYSVDEDNTLSVSAADGVLKNDNDPEGATLTATLVSGPAQDPGFVLNSDGSFTYTPTPDFNGSDSFTYRANDGALNSNIATVTITVNPVNDPPIAVDDSYSTDQETPLVVPVGSGVLVGDSDPDGDALTAILVSGPSDAASFSLNDDGSFSYTPEAGFSGADSFSYQANDGSLNSNTATVTITVNPGTP